MVPSYETNEWQVIIDHRKPGTGSAPVINIRVLEGEEWRDYWVPDDPANADFAQYQDWLAQGNEPALVF